MKKYPRALKPIQKNIEYEVAFKPKPAPAITYIILDFSPYLQMLAAATLGAMLGVSILAIIYG